MLYPVEPRGRGGFEVGVERTGARTLPRGDSSSELDKVACLGVTEVALVTSESFGTSERSSSTVLPFRRLTPEELAASIRGNRLGSSSIALRALA